MHDTDIATDGPTTHPIEFHMTTAEYQAWQAQTRADTLRAAARDIPSAYLHGDSPSAWLTRLADEMEGA